MGYNPPVGLKGGRMTINIPLKAVAFVLYTLALLGGAFGISYVVFEWRDDDEALDASSIERRIDELEREISAGPTQAELDAERDDAERENDRLCLQAQQADAAAEAAYYEKAASGGLGVFQQPLFDAGFAGYQTPPSIQGQIDRYCQ